MSDLVKRLRKWYQETGAPSYKEAADEIERLQTEIERLKAELEKEKRMTKTALRMPFMQSTPRGWKFIPEDEDEK